ncbi:hypothetical protein ACLE20_04855 [Rhizobium sp. YIM 134829]|uniref:hypothetical protein n=1 Tax=Rhizobium sp. YIM 134829 TaxID=3390453 RepID=UPI00397ADF61
MTQQCEKKRRRERGPSARGEFEQSKAVAEEVSRTQAEEARQKTERLKAARLAQAGDIRLTELNEQQPPSSIAD